MSPASRELDVLLAPGEAGVRAIPIALHRAFKIARQHVVQAGCRATDFPLVNGIATRTRSGPKVAGLGLAISGREIAYRRFIDLDVTTGHDPGPDRVVDRLEPVGHHPHPPGLALPRQPDPMARPINLLLPVER